MLRSAQSLGWALQMGALPIHRVTGVTGARAGACVRAAGAAGAVAGLAGAGCTGSGGAADSAGIRSGKAEGIGVAPFGTGAATGSPAALPPEPCGTPEHAATTARAAAASAHHAALESLSFCIIRPSHCATWRSLHVRGLGRPLVFPTSVLQRRYRLRRRLSQELAAHSLKRPARRRGDLLRRPSSPPTSRSRNSPPAHPAGW